MASDEEHDPMYPTTKDSSQGTDHSACARPDATVAIPQGTPITPTYPTSSDRGDPGTSATPAATTPTISNRSGRNKSTVLDDDRHDESEWRSPVPPLPRNFELSSLERLGRTSILSNVTERTEEVALSPVLDGEHHIIDARTTAGTVGESNDQHREASAYEESIAPEPSQTGGSLAITPGYERSAIDHDPDAAITRDRPGHRRPQASTSYQNHTKASKAKQSEKVEPSLTRESSQSTFREPPGYLTTQRSTSALDHRDVSTRPSPRRLEFGRDDYDPVSRPGSRHTSNVVTPGRIPYARRANDTSRDSHEGTRSASRWPSESPQGNAGFHERLHDELAKLQQGLQQQEEDNETNSGVLGHGNNQLSPAEEVEEQADDLSVALLPQREGHDETDSEKFSGGGIQSIPAEVREDRINHSNVNSSQHSPGDARCEDDPKVILQSQNEVLQEEIADRDRQLEGQSEELGKWIWYAQQVRNHLAASEEELVQLKQDIVQITNAIDQSQQASADVAPSTDAINDLTQHLDSSDEITNLRTSFSEVLSHFTTKIHILTQTNTTLQETVTAQFHELELSIQAFENKPLTSAQDRDTWRQLWVDLRKQRNQLKVQLNQSDSLVKENNLPDLAKRNRELEVNLTHTRDKARKLSEATKKYKDIARQWADEVISAKSEMERKEAVFGAEVKRLDDEMLGYIKDYYDKRHEPGDCDSCDLQKRIKELERELAGVNDMSNATKTEKARLEEQIGRVFERNEWLEKEVERLGSAVMMGGNVDQFGREGMYPAHVDSPRSSFLGDSSESMEWLTSPKRAQNHGPFIPRCHLPAAIDARNVETEKLKKEQQQRRDEEEKAIAIMEQLRKWNLNRRNLPDTEDWKKLTKQSAWERWEGDKWLQETVRRWNGMYWEEEVTSEEDRIVAGQLKEKGIVLMQFIFLQESEEAGLSAVTILMSALPISTSTLSPGATVPGSALPALTTVFTPPSNCSTRWVQPESNRLYVWSGAGSYDSGVHRNYWPSCNAFGQSTQVAYSPGICAIGYLLSNIRAVAFGTSSSSPSLLQYVALCCPSGMTVPILNGSATSICRGMITTPLTAMQPISITEVINGKTFPTLVYDTISESISVRTLPNMEEQTVRAVLELKSPTVLTSGIAEAAAMTVYWQASDISNFPSAYAASIAALIATTTSSTVSIPEPTTTLPNNTMTTATRLSTGAKVGIGVGTALGGITLFAVFIALLLRHRKKKHAAQDPSVPEMSGYSSGFKRFLHGKWRSEAEAKSEPVEIDSRNVNVIPGPPVELDASR
ncbi:hypothetical protein BKA63DRAFT_488233 [Paraphoma chrysanthemicola]|nr:hypothetical protein BKA63DRAFT_488233 [Paraphoma chrysanthemicola]